MFLIGIGEVVCGGGDDRVGGGRDVWKSTKEKMNDRVEWCAYKLLSSYTTG